ncbi:putative pectate lyase E [Colletotrichum liriopes]|uniref:Pectate lyase n=1 Tax=Colletotrichum liriopes TaxID=708192 RepID=A0AA37GJI3_9PEZI|nr:putative pectate lyase E [Colletotrichum liriopes]
MKFSAVIAAISATAAFAAPGAETSPNNFGAIEKRASFPIPASKGTVTYKAAKAVSGTFDGGLKTYGRGVKCTGQAEGGDKDAVFILDNGATLKNAIIGADQIEGVHCKGSCTIQNVWWTAGDTSTITGTCATSVKEVCTEFQGTTPGNEPKKLRSGPSTACKYSTLKAC